MDDKKADARTIAEEEVGEARGAPIPDAAKNRPATEEVIRLPYRLGPLTTRHPAPRIRHSTTAARSRGQASPRLLDHLVGADEQRLRHGEAKRIGSF